MRDTRRFSAAATAAGVLLILSGCGADTQRQAEPVERDSAGIHIVENRSALYVDGSAWRVADEPSLEIGVLDGPPAYQFHLIRGALRLSDGRVAVADGGFMEVRIFDPSGEYLASGGRQGGGPGEFQAIDGFVRLAGDSLLVHDSQLRRLTVLDDATGFVRELGMAELGDPAPSYVGGFPDGALLLRAPSGIAAVGTPSGGTTLPRNGLVRDTAIHLLFDPVTERADTLGAFAGRETLINIATSGGEVTSISIMRPAFFAHSAVGTSGDFAYYADSKRYEFALHARSGELVRLVRREHTPEPVSSHYLDRLYRSQVAAGAPEQTDPFAGIPIPQALPVFRGALPDAEGNLWVERFRWPDDEHSDWDVFDADGRWLTTLSTPPGFRPTDIGADFVLGVWTDDLEVQRVRLYGLYKPDRPSE